MHRARLRDSFPQGEQVACAYAAQCYQHSGEFEGGKFAGSGGLGQWAKKFWELWERGKKISLGWWGANEMCGYSKLSSLGFANNTWVAFKLC